jgi:glycosyltransferase involved in cell wall biosynthesis
MKILLIAPVGFATSNENPNAIHGGYGNCSIGILRVLLGLKNEKIIDDVQVVDTASKNIQIPLDDDFDIAILNYPPSVFSTNPQVANSLKVILSKAKRKYYHIVWETEPLPRSFVSIFNNDFFDGFLAPSYWGIEQIKKETKKEVFYFPHFIDEKDWSLADMSIKEKEKIFTVLFIGQNTIRKGINDAVVSFARALGDKKDCQLLLKLTKASQLEIPIANNIHSLLHLNQTNKKAKIDYIDANISNEEIGELYDLSSLLLFCSRSEGFGMPAAEAMLQGLPVLYTNFSSLPDVCKSKVNIGVSATVDEAYGMITYGYEKGTHYGIPRISELMNALEFYYSKWKEDKKLYYEAASINRQIIIDRFSYEIIKNYYKKLLFG